MSDTGGPESTSISAKLGSWVVDGYRIAKWAVDEPLRGLVAMVSRGKTAEPPKIRAMQKLQDTLDPRPDKTKPPPGATTDEAKAIDEAFKGLTEHVAQNIDSDDTSEAKSRLRDLLKLVVETTLAVDLRAQIGIKRQAMENYLAQTVVSPDLPADLIRSLAKRRSALARAIANAATLSDMEAVDDHLRQLRDDVTAADLLTTPRKEAQTEIAAARKARATLGPQVDRGFFAAVTEAIAAAEVALSKARLPKEITDLRKTLKEVMDKAADARNYAAHYDTWWLRTEGFLEVYCPDPSRSVRHPARDTRNALAEAAAAKAAKADFTAARSELAKFDAHSTVTSVGGADFAGSTGFMEKLDAFRKSHGAALETITRTAMPCKTGIRTAFKAVQKKGIKQKLWTDATNDLAAFATRIDKLLPIADWYLEHAAIKGSVAETEEPMVSFNAAIANADLKIAADGTGDHADALSGFSGIASATVDAARALGRLRAIERRAAGAGIAGHTDAEAHLLKDLATIKADIAADPPEAAKAMTALEAVLKDLEPWIAAAAEAKVARGLHDSGNAFKLLDAAEKAASTHDYAKARVLGEAAVKDYAVLGEFLALERQVMLTLSAQTNATPAHTLLSTALTEADDLARKQAKITDALARLSRTLADPGLAEAMHEAGLWLRRQDAVTARHKKILPDLAPAKVAEAVKDSLALAVEAADVKHDYPAAMARLDQHEEMLREARAYVAARARVTSIKQALDRAVATFASVPDVAKKLYGGPDDSGMKADIGKAEDLAIKGDLSKAAKAFDGLLKSWKPLLKETARLHEAQDGAKSNAGHSIDRHGPEVSDEDLLKRLTTGIAADGKTSATSASSRFDNFEAWLQGREEGARMLEGKTQPDGTAIKVSDKSVPADAAAVVSMKAEIDHKGPIDKAFVGVKPNTGVDAQDGILTKGDTYETWEEKDGITKSQTLWLFEIDISGIADHLRPPHGSGPNSATKWNSTPQAYITAYTAKHGSAPTSIPGEWVMMQLFPLVAGWDQEKQDYA